MTMAMNITAPIEEPEWNSKPAWKLPGWVEPIIVASILFTAMFMTRRRGFRIFDKPRSRYNSLLDSPEASHSSDELLPYNSNDDDDLDDYLATSEHPPKQRNCCGTAIHTPNSSRFKNNIHSRILRRFPFLMEVARMGRTNNCRVYFVHGHVHDEEEGLPHIRQVEVGI